MSLQDSIINLTQLQINRHYGLNKNNDNNSKLLKLKDMHIMFAGENNCFDIVDLETMKIKKGKIKNPIKN